MIDFLRDNACCYDSDSSDPETRDCLDLWKEQLEQVSIECTKKSATTAKDEEEYQNSLGWQNRLKNWEEIIKDTDEKADIIVNELKFFLDQTTIVCNNSEVATEELGKLFGLVKCIFDCFFTYENNKPGLKDKISDFKKAVECLKNTSDEDKAEVIACIEDYEQKIILVCDMLDAVLTKLMETFKCANLLCKSICGDGGLEDKIEGLQSIFKEGNDMDDCGDDHDGHNGNGDDDDDDDKAKKRKKKPRHDHHYSYPCDDTVVKPMPVFPISESDYYKNIESDLARAVHKTIELKDDWVSSKEQSDRCLSQKTSLIEAISAAEAAEKA
ncbi:hypothetical protein [Aquimarina sp. MMG016]|uniref:hypothetical protein n=1 Tax=Aquimarina sp. MMG016 TaxID=2822690 RepID=UPI001B3A2CD8|nr:hypothetical protein [Aquimarina sp. MMG016]MBQ4818586.1 hypothetical protein [Aquimarina sp. MMG016]